MNLSVDATNSTKRWQTFAGAAGVAREQLHDDRHDDLAALCAVSVWPWFRELADLKGKVMETQRNSTASDNAPLLEVLQESDTLVATQGKGPHTSPRQDVGH